MHKPEWFRKKFTPIIPKQDIEALKPLFQAEIEKLELPNEQLSTLENIYLPFYHCLIEKELHPDKSFTLGICGAQGSGKTTFVQLLQLILEKLFNLKVASFSIDDFYLTRQERTELSRKIHPLLKARGVPGTHDVNLGMEVLEKLISNTGNAEIKVPVFDKSMDDRLPVEKWSVYKYRPDVILFEGWCVGAVPQSSEKLITPINELEELSDKDGSYRKYINSILAGEYNNWFSKIDKLVLLKVPSFDCVYEWRLLQEKKLEKTVKSLKTSKLMNEKQVLSFIQHYERLTRHMHEEMPQRADVVFEIDEGHTISGVHLKNEVQFNENCNF